MQLSKAAVLLPGLASGAGVLPLLLASSLFHGSAAQLHHTATRMVEQAARSAAQWVVVVRLGARGREVRGLLFFLTADDGHVYHGNLGESRGCSLALGPRAGGYNIKVA